MAVSYPPLLSALMALSAIHRNSLYSPNPLQGDIPREIITLKASSISRLRSELLATTLDGNTREAVLATALTLCMCDIHSGADQPRSWRLHLQGANAILSSISTGLSSNLEINTQGWLLKRWYTSIEVLAAISSKGLRDSGSLDISTLHRNEDMGNKNNNIEIILDDYFGFTTDLVALLKEIGVLAHERKLLSETGMTTGNVVFSDRDLFTEGLLLESRIQSIITRDRNSAPPLYPGVEPYLSTKGIEELYLCNEAYQYTALIHVYRRIMGIPSTDSRVQNAVKQILKCVGGIQPSEGLSVYIVLVMPLFTAGQEAFGEDRERVRERMKVLGEKLRLRNVWRSREILENIWNGGNEQGIPNFRQHYIRMRF
jgi:hypothetical protein